MALIFNEIEVEDGAIAVGEFADETMDDICRHGLRFGRRVGDVSGLVVELHELQPGVVAQELERVVQYDSAHPSAERTRPAVLE